MTVPRPPDCPVVVIDRVATTEPGGDGFFPADFWAWLKKVRARSGNSVSVRSLSQTLLSDKVSSADLAVLAAGLRTFAERLDDAIGSGRIADPSGVRLPAVVRVAQGIYVVTGSATEKEIAEAPRASEQDLAVARYQLERLVSLAGSLAETAARAGKVRARIRSAAL